MSAFYHQSKSNVSRLPTKHVNIQACDYESIHAYEHLSIQVHIPLISQPSQHSSTIVNTFEHKNLLLHDHFSLRANRHFIIQVCVHVYGYQTCEYQCM